MDITEIESALTLAQADGVILRTIVIEMLHRDPRRAEIVEAVAREFAEQQLRSTYKNHRPEFRAALRHLWPIYQPLLGTG